MLLPQWALEIFMEKFNLSQCDALNRIKMQDDLEIQKQVEADFEEMF